MPKVEYPVVNRTPRPVMWFDLDRLADLRDRHRRLLEDYRRAGAAARTAAQEAAQARAALLLDPLAAQVASLSTEKLAQLTVEQLAEVHIDARAVQRIATLEQRAKRLRTAHEGMAFDVSNSNAYAAKLEAFAQANNL